MLKLNILHAPILLSHLLPIFVDINRLGIELGPFKVGLKCELVCMSWDICFGLDHNFSGLSEKD